MANQNIKSAQLISSYHRAVKYQIIQMRKAAGGGGTSCCHDCGMPQKLLQKEMNCLGLQFAQYVNIEWESLQKGFCQ